MQIIVNLFKQAKTGARSPYITFKANKDYTENFS